jgi:putative FmdB family regulatory protein
MPIYEYRCNGCSRRVQLFFRSFSAADNPVCPHCQSIDLGRLPSRVAQIRSDSSREEMFTDPSNFANLDYENPRAVAEWARRMGDAAGIDMGDDYDEVLDQIEQGGGMDDMGGMGGLDDLGGMGGLGQDGLGIDDL